MGQEELTEQLVLYKHLARVHKELAEQAEQKIRDLERRISFLESEIQRLRKSASPGNG